MSYLRRETRGVSFKISKSLIKSSFIRGNNGSYVGESSVDQIVDKGKIFTGSARLLMDSSPHVSLTISGTFPTDTIVGSVKLYKKSCGNPKQFFDVLHRHNSDKNEWISFKVLDLNDIFSNVYCSLPTVEFVLQVDLFYSAPLGSEIAKNVENLENAKHADITLSVKDKEFKVHQVLLIEKSSVFARMFSHKTTKEFLEGAVKIEDFKPEVVKNFLIFIYSGVVIDYSVIPDLYLFADKYEITELKEICTKKIIEDSSIAADTVVGTLIVAEKLEHEDTKEKCFDFIKNNENFLPGAVFSSSWARIIQEYPELAEKVRELCNPKEN